MRVLAYWLLVLACLPIAVEAQLTTKGASQISVGQGNVAPQEPRNDGLGGSNGPVAPPNGDFVVFSSRASNLSNTPDTNESFDIYRHSPSTGIQLISLSQSNAAPAGPLNYGSFSPAVSPVLSDGSYAVAFASDATDLVPNYKSGGLTTNPPQIYVRFPASGLTVLVSKRATHTDNQGANAQSDQPTITITGQSPNKFAVCFRSYATDITNSGVNRNEHSNIYCTQITLNANGQASVDPILEITQANDGNLDNPVLSGNGKFLAFSSAATIITGIQNGEDQIYLYEFRRPSSPFTLISKDSSGGPSVSHSTEPSLSFSGETVTFKAANNGSIKGLENNTKDILVQYDARTGAYFQLNTNAANEKSNGDLGSGKVDPRGRFAVFSDNGTNLTGTPESSNGKYQTYLKDLKSGRIIRTSVTAADVNVAGDDDSGKREGNYQPLPITLGGGGYNSRTVFASFISMARNFGGPGAPFSFNDPYTYFPYLFKTSIILPPRPLVRRAPLEAPPDLAIIKRRKKNLFDIRIDLQKFTLSQEATATLRTTLEASSSARTQYTIEIKKAGSKKRITRIVSRNTATIRKLSAGRYTIRYRVSGKINKKTVRSSYSPKATLVIS